MKIAVINDLSGMGRCSLAASIPILNTLGHTVYPVPTAVLSNQTEYDDYTFFDFTPQLKEYIGVWKRMGVKFDCVYSGFLSNVSQGEIVLDLFTNCSERNAWLVIDPVMGDGGVTYDTFDDALCKEVKKLANAADIITPNLTEACILTGEDYKRYVKIAKEDFFEIYYSLAERCAAITKGGRAVITGVTLEGDTSHVYNFTASSEGRFFTKNKMYGGHYSGTGDITASVIAGCLMSGKKLSESVTTAADFTEAAVKYSFNNGVNKNDGVDFERFLPMLYSASQKITR